MELAECKAVVQQEIKKVHMFYYSMVESQIIFSCAELEWGKKGLFIYSHFYENTQAKLTYIKVTVVKH